MNSVVLLILGCLVIVAIIAANGFFVAQEFAFMSVDRHRLRAAAESGDQGAKNALAITRRTSFMLSGAQLGITVTGLLVGYVAEPMVGAALSDLLGGTALPPAVVVGASTFGVLALATVVQMIIGELYPKNLAIANPMPLVKTLALPTRFYLLAFGWLIWIFDKAAEGLLRLLRIEPVHDVDSTATAEDLDRIVLDSADSGSLPRELSLLIDRVIEFPDRDAEHAMMPRSQVDTVAPETTVGTIRTIMAGGHTRYPVISHEHAPVGVVHLVDVLAHPGLAPETPVTELMRPAVLVPTLMPLPDALDALTEANDELACVIDEYGGFAGVVTLEDLAEELVGDLTDEHDDAPAPAIDSTGEGRWLASGDIALDELERTIGVPLPDVDAETVAGLVIATIERLPEPHEQVRVELPADPREVAGDDAPGRYLLVDVESVERNVPDQLAIELHSMEPEDAADDDETGGEDQ